MDDTNKGLHQCMERLVWDFLDLHGFLSGRKAEVTLLASLTMILVGRYRLQMKDLAGIFNVSSSTVTDYVDYLENRGYVKRVRSEKDRREVYIELTDIGKEWVSNNKKVSWEYLDERLGKLTSEERRMFISLMCKFMEIEEPPDFIRSPK